ECLLPSGEPCFAGGRTSTAQPVSPGTPSPTAPAANFSENFDGVTAPALPTGWTTSFVNGTNCFSGSNWVTSTADPASAPNSACHTDPACVTDNYLVSPSISITSTSPTLS